MMFKSYEHFYQRPRPADMMFRYDVRYHFAYQWLDNLKINKYAKFDPNKLCVVQELRAVSLTDYDRLDWCSAKPCPPKGLFHMPVVR